MITYASCPLQACHEDAKKRYPPQVMKALDGVPYVAKHLKDSDDGGKVIRLKPTPAPI
jgi:hypothetical protein